jgi:integrase
MRKGTMAAPSRLTLREAAEQWLTAIERGDVLSRRRTPYKPSVTRGYRRDLTKYVLPELGALRLSEVRRAELQLLVDDLVSRKLSGSKVRNVVTPVQAMYRWAKQRQLVDADPTDDLELPEVTGSREWDGTPADVAALLAALLEEHRAFWATPAYAGLRRGELRAMRVGNLVGLDPDADERWIEVEHGWDDVEGEQGPKSKAGVRRALMPETLRVILAEHVERTGRSGDDLVFGRTAELPFTPGHPQDLADKAWKAAGLERTTLHLLRHACGSFLNAAGISETRADRYMGHGRATVGDRYRHALKGQLVQDARRLDDYLHGRTAEVVRLPVRETEPGVQSATR